jgi:hypothetical protein
VRRRFAEKQYANNTAAGMTTIYDTPERGQRDAATTALATVYAGTAY